MGRKSKLTSEEIQDIRESTEPQKALADKYLISQQHVSYIRSGDRLMKQSEVIRRGT